MQLPHSFLQQATQRLHRTRLRRNAEMEELFRFWLWDLSRVGAKRGRYRTGGGTAGGWYHAGWESQDNRELAERTKRF